jgi:hypothetical protein
MTAWAHCRVSFDAQPGCRRSPFTIALSNLYIMIQGVATSWSRMGLVVCREGNEIDFIMRNERTREGGARRRKKDSDT